MKRTILKSSQFRKEREASWRELDSLVGRMEKRSTAALEPSELMRLPTLYRAALSSLSVARAISLDRSLLAYLENLANRAYFQIYGPRAGLGEVLAGFFARSWPNAVRATGRPALLSIAVTILSALAGYWLTMADMEWYYTLMPEDLAAGRSPASSTESLRAVLYDGDDADGGALSAFSSFLFVHNSRIALLCFALGIALGVPTLLLLVSNGLMLGSFFALYASRGLGFELGGWLIIHGGTELLAVALCGGAGLALADAFLFPGQKTRLQSLAERGRLAGLVALGAVFMLAIAGILEGIGRQVITDDLMRYTIGIGMLVLWSFYFLTGDRSSPQDGSSHD
ncbi:stage II sporulation protein M [Dongia deserti]|uniref:stage II sporulation protein M n=1 Tax=Dongia deserti TaxID=2268030 RepID=UPI000E64A75E|nr:stage II sporulation protein M [Dongia deserti]